MKPADLDRIETALQIKLPQDYRRIMQEYSFPPESTVADMLVDDPEVLLRWNAGEKKPSAQHADDPLANGDFFNIGSDCGELRFFIRLTDSTNAIFCYDLESGNLSEYSKNIAEYIEQCMRVDAGAEGLPNERDDIPERMKWLFSLGLLALLILFGYGVFKLIRWLL